MKTEVTDLETANSEAEKGSSNKGKRIQGHNNQYDIQITRHSRQGSAAKYIQEKAGFRESK
ncbi:hypothetical protein [Microbulbifer variabilis]|uniref:hypothetical protein n=1 Tax=Microbulbifer variabilis TaxID=266805 RepID=UPI001CFE1B0F|nr:hypothetical protein [Microbulbifer variabilis]